eukprot:s5572_g6.t1
MAGPTMSQDPLTALLGTYGKGAPMQLAIAYELVTSRAIWAGSWKAECCGSQPVDRIPQASSPVASKSPEVAWSEEETTVYVGKLLRMQHPGHPGAEKAVAQFLKDLLGEVSLPEPWVMLRSSRGRVFFCNMATRQTTWDHPLEGSLLEAATICKQVLQLDEPWRANLTAHLLEVVEQFRHTETGLFSWTPPREIAAELFQCKRAALAKLCHDRYVRQLQLQEPSIGCLMLMEAVDDTSQGSRTPSRPASEILPRHVLSATTSALLAQISWTGLLTSPDHQSRERFFSPQLTPTLAFLDAVWPESRLQAETSAERKPSAERSRSPWQVRGGVVPPVAGKRSMAAASEETPLLARKPDAEENFDSMNYDARKLVTFEVFWNFSGTVWMKSSLWKMMGILLMIALCIASSVALMVSDPAELDVGRFQRISTFLEVVVGLLLGFFLSSSVQRWYNCTNGFLELFDAIRSLHMQLNALGVPKERLRLCLRYCVVSAHCLDNDLIASAMAPSERVEFLRGQWDTLAADAEDGDVFTDRSKSFATLLPSEREILKKIEDPAQTLWVWVTSLLTRMAADGETPPIPSPTYGRIITIAEQAYSGIRTVRASIRVQPPYVHVQMMAALVLVNNLINAVSFGMTAGVTVSMCLARYHISPTSKTPGSADVSHSLQDLAVGLILATVGPFLYQALLEVAVCIAQPFTAAGHDSKSPGRIPTEKLLCNLEKDLRDIEHMSLNLPWWKQTYFKSS